MNVASAIGTYVSCSVSETDATTADTVIADITHDDRPNISPASSRHGAERRGGLFTLCRTRAPVSSAAAVGAVCRRQTPL